MKLSTSQLRKLLQRPIAFHRVFADIAGSATAGLFLSQLWYWHDKGADPDGWIYKTRDEWEEETALTRYEQERARIVLKALGLMEEKYKGLPGRLHFRLDVDRLGEMLMEPTEIQVNEEGNPIRTRKSKSVPPQVRRKMKEISE